MRYATITSVFDFAYLTFLTPTGDTYPNEHRTYFLCHGEERPHPQWTQKRSSLAFLCLRRAQRCGGSSDPCFLPRHEILLEVCSRLLAGDKGPLTKNIGRLQEGQDYFIGLNPSLDDDTPGIDGRSCQDHCGLFFSSRFVRFSLDSYFLNGTILA